MTAEATGSTNTRATHRPGLTGVLRSSLRLFRCALVLGALWVEFRGTRDHTPAANARRMQRTSRRLLRIANIPVTVDGEMPEHGLIVSNHLSYLDVLVLGSQVPSIFVSKEEVRGWPFVGGLIAGIGTIFLKRESIRAAAEVNRTIAQTLKVGLPVVFFPEGTTNDEPELLPFQPALFDSSVKSRQPIRPVALRYTINGGDAGVHEDVCYLGDTVFGPHLVKLLRLNSVAAHLVIAKATIAAENRGEAAEQSREVVTALLNRMHGRTAPMSDRAASMEEAALS